MWKKLMLPVLGVAASLGSIGISLVTAPQAAAYTDEDVTYLGCLASGWGHPSDNPESSVRWGHQIANAIQAGDTPIGDRNYLLAHSDIAGVREANVMVNCATSVYLGFGPPVV